MESQKKIVLKEGKIYFFICYALTCGGKSTFFEQILSQTNDKKDKFNVKFVSSDQIRSELANELQKNNPEMDYQQCFDKVGKSTAKKFDTQIQEAIQSKEEKKINIILVDKNYPQGINKFLKSFCTNKASDFFLIFTPNNQKILSINNKTYPFSIDYIIQCYLRLKNRTGHETLNGTDENSKFVYFSFLKLFEGFDFIKNTCTDDSFKDNVFISRISFTDETKNLNLEENSMNFFTHVMKKLKPFDMKKYTEKQKKEIEDYCKYIEEKFEQNCNYFEDTRGKIKSEVNNILNNGVEFI